MAFVTTDWLKDALILSLLSLLGLYFYLKKNFDYWKKFGVKELPPTFFFGNAAACLFRKKTPTEFIHQLYQLDEDAKMIGFHIFDKPYLLLRDPELIKHVFVKDFHNFSNKLVSGEVHDTFGNSNLFLIQNPPWVYIRKKITPVFTSGKLKKMFNYAQEICEEFDRYLDNLNIDDTSGKSVEMMDLFGRLSTDLAGRAIFGINFNSLLDSKAVFRKMGHNMFRSDIKRYYEMLAIFFIPSLRPYLKPRFFDKGTEFFRKAFREVIDQRMKTGLKRFDLIDLLIEVKKNQNNEHYTDYKITEEELLAQTSVFFSGGFETPSTTMSFAAYELAINLDLQRKLRNEILDGLETTNGKLTYDMVATLPFLNMIVQETMRKYPLLPWLDRVSESDYTFAGTNVTVKKGTPIILPTCSMQNDPKYYPDPEKFDPERFSDENKNKIIPFTYFPLGEGPRNCIGARIGIMHTKLGLISIFSKYEVTKSHDTPIPIKLDNLNVFTHIHGGLNLNLRKISS